MNLRGRTALALVLVFSTTLASCERSPTGPSAAARRVSPPNARVQLGKTVQFSSIFPDRLTHWWVAEGPGAGVVSETGFYRAPFIRPPDSTATVRASFYDTEGSAEVTFEPGGPDSSDCCGPGQARLPAMGDYVYVETLPEALVRVPPTYPQEAIDAGVQGTVLLQALVCASGQLIDVRVQQSVPLLDAAAVDAVRQWFFLPATNAGQPLAVWVAIPIRFTLNAPALAGAPATLR